MRTRLGTMLIACSLLLAGTGLVGPGAAAVRAVDTTPPVIDSVRCDCFQPYQYSTVGFTTVAHDDESGIASIAWAFDDGLTASGATVTRELRAPGPLVATVTVTDGAGNMSIGTASVDVLANPYPPEPSYTSPYVSRVRLRPGTLSAGGRTPGVPRSARLTFRLRDDFATTGIRVLVRDVRGDLVARRDLRGLREGDRSVRLGSRVGGVRLLTGRYRVTVRATNDYGAEESGGVRLRVVR